MTAEELLDRVAQMLGFRVTERDNDAVLIREKAEGAVGSRSVRPATREELIMFLRLIGVVSRLDETVSENSRLEEALSKCEAAIKTMGASLQSADAVIKELMAANHGLGEASAEMERRLEDKESELRDVYGRNEDIEEKLKELGAEA
jgi:chromosome segregation ATPase